MFTHFRRSLLSLAREQPAALWLVFGMLLAGPSLAADRVERTARAISPVVVTNFEQIWQMTEAETKEWHRLRMEYVVYYYDPLWQAMWGRCGEADSYLSVGSKPFPIKPGQKILVEGLILPAAGMNVDEPRVTVLAETAPVEVLSTAGEIGNSQRFNKRLVTVEGYVDRQSARDANHHELALVVEGQSVLVQFLVRTGEIVPALKGALIRAQGVYFARNEPTWTSPRLEIWVPGIKSITELGRIERDDRFRPPPTPIDRLGEAPPDRLVRIVGTVQAQQPGKSLTLLGETGQLTFPTVQTQPVAADEQVEVIGYPVRRGTEWSVQQGLYRPVQKIIGSFEELGLVPEERRNEVHKARFDFLVYYYDPRWKVAWGRCAGSDNFLALGEVPFPVRPGQLIHLEGLVVPANGMVLDELKVTPLAEPVSLEALTTTGRIGQTELFDKHMVTVDGRVERQTPIDSTHLKIDLIAEGRPVTVRLLLEGDTAPPELEGAVLRVKGVYSATRDSTGAEPKLEVWVQGLPNIEVLQQPAKAPLPRGSLRVIANFDDLQMVPESERKQAHQVRLDFLVYFHDPRWKVAWGRCAGSDNYLALGEVPFPLRPGQLVHIEGTVIPANGIISEPKITSLAEPVPLEVLSTKGQIGQTERFDKHMVTLEGYADRQTATDGTHLKIDLVSEGRAVAVRLLFDGKTILPDMEGALLRLKGVYSATIDPTGALPNIEVWVQDQQNIEVIGSLAQDAQFDLPATSIEKLPSAEAGKLVRVVGVVRKQQAGLSLTIRDETGQLILHTAQTRPVQLGEQVEAIGYPLLVGTEWHLRESMYRHAQTANGAPAHDLAQLRLAEQLLDLSHEEAKRGHPVHLNGVVTWVNPAADFFYIRDASGGVCVLRPREPGSALRVGAKVEVSGVSAPGKFVPVVQAIGVVQTASIDMPEAKQVTLEQALTGIEEAQWVGMSGYVRDVAQDGPWGRLELTTSAGEFAAVLPWGEQLVNLRRSVVRMRGVCSALTNEKRQLTGIQLWVPSEQYLEIEEAEPANPFTVAAQSITSLRQFSSLQATNRRVRVAGVVVHHAPGLRALIQEGSEGLLVLSRDTTPLVPGDRIEAVGFPGRENSRVVLREAVYHRLSSGAEPVPLVVDSLDRINVELDSRLVRIDAQLLDVGAQEKGTRLIMQAGGVIFEALLDAQKSTVPDRWASGSRLALTGVYQVQFDEYKRPHAMQLQLRSLGDVTILSRAPWWTTRRALLVIAVLAVGIVLGFGWVVALRRRVHRQTGQIREQVESEKAARLEAALARASKLESLGVLAGGIAHDFNNLLTVVMGNLSLAKLDPRINPETVECLQESQRAALRARDLTQQLITFAKGGEPVRAVTVLPEVVGEATRFALHGSKVRCDYDIAPDIWPADVDKGQIGQVVHNIIINATHAMPDGGVVRITLRNEDIAAGVRPALAPGRYLHLTIADEGTGIEPEHLPLIFDPYFTTKAKGSGLGLATVYSIIKKHQGHIEVESRRGVGTTFHIWLPAVATAQLPPAAEAQPRPPQTARVLFMDDETPIRLMAGVILKRMGLECTAVVDGAEVLQEYVAARANGRPYDLVMLDLTVPGGMGGVETMKKLLQLDPEVRAIVSSGYSTDPVMANFRLHGFLGRVAKPYDMAEFMKTVSAILPDHAGKN